MTARSRSGPGRKNRATQRVIVLLCMAAGVAWGIHPSAAGGLMIADQSGVQRFDTQTGYLFGVSLNVGYNGLVGPSGLAFGPDGDLYICDASATTSQVLRYDISYNSSSIFIANYSGGLNYPIGLVFGRDGNLYVASANTDQVLRYSGATGAFMDAFVSVGSGGLAHPQGLVFGPDGNLYVASGKTNQVLRYSGTTGAFLGTFVAAGSGGLNYPLGMTFGPDGNLYVASFSSNQVLRYNGSTGAFMDTFVPSGSGGLVAPSSLAFGPDGRLYVSDYYTDAVLRYVGTSGAFVDAAVSRGAVNPTALVFSPPAPPSNLYASGLSATQIFISWSPVDTEATGITVWRSGGGADWAEVATLPARSTNFIDNGLLPGVSYSYRVRTVSSYGISSSFNEPTATTISLIPGVSELYATSSGPGMISLSWGPSSGAPITGYFLWRKGGGADWAQIAVLPGSLTSYVDTGLAANTQYTYRLRSFNDAAASLDWSDEASAWTPIVPPAAPTGLTATAASSSQIDLTWTLHSTDELAVAVWRKSGTGDFTRVAALPPHTASYSDTGLSSGTTYTYEVRVTNSFFASPWSNQVAASTP